MWFVEYHENNDNKKENLNLENQNIVKRIVKNMSSSKYDNIDIKDICKYIFSSYEILESFKYKLDIGVGEKIAERILWNDMCIDLVTRRLQDFNLSKEIKYTCYNYFMNDIFKAYDFTKAEDYYSNIENNKDYRKYFKVCFELGNQKQFWKWIGYIVGKDKDILNRFIDEYNNLSNLIGLSLFLDSKPASDKWLQRLETEKLELNKFKKNYTLYNKPEVYKLCNPIYPSEIYVDNSKNIDNAVESALNTPKNVIVNLESESIVKRIVKNMSSIKYDDIDIKDICKYIISSYEILKSFKYKLDIGVGEKIAEKILWNDMCIDLVTRRLQDFNPSKEIKYIYYNYFMNDIFKAYDFTKAEDYYCNLENNKDYRKYFEVCFDLAGQKQFWKWIGYIGKKDTDMLIKFIDEYNNLSNLIGLLLYLDSKPESDKWLRRLEIEKLELNKIQKNYFLFLYMNPDVYKLCNPIYPDEIYMDNSEKVGSKNIENTNRTKIYKKKIQIEIEYSLNKEEFEKLLSNKSLENYLSACELLLNCNLPQKMEDLYKELMVRIKALEETLSKYGKVYNPSNLETFYEYYIPETLQLTAGYTEYLDIKVGETVSNDVEKEILDNLKTLIMAINDKIDEIYKFASIDLKAEAMALKSIMNKYGYVEDSYKINE